jgi:excisionase family DNA binding protein
MTAHSKNCRLMTVPDVADAAQVSTKTVWRWIDRGVLRCHRLGVSVRITPEDFEAMLNKSRQ